MRLKSITDPCRCCPAHCGALTRRQWLARSAALPLAASTLSPARAQASAGGQQPVRLPLKVQPVLLYQIHTRREATSWRPWGGLHTEQDAAQEKARIGAELGQMAKAADFPVEILPPREARDQDGAVAAARGDHDVMLVYAAGGSVKMLETLAGSRWNLVFVRHRSGPVYLWYEIAHPRFLRKTVDDYGQPGMDVEDVVVDSHSEILWRLRALAGLKNTLAKRIVAVGGPGGWGAGGKAAPELARKVWKLDIRTVTYDELGQRIRNSLADDARVRRARVEAERYLKGEGVSLETRPEFVHNAFLLTEVFHDLLDAAGTDAITINQCMSTIMPIARTTACMALSLLNDAGYMAFCESDFVVIPSGILLRYISGKPVFFNDPTYPHDGLVTLAHCTAPRKMNGREAEPVRILTHFESDYGAAPKVEMSKGEKVTNLVPDFNVRKWVGFEGEIVDAPFLPICRSQIDVAVRGDWRKLLAEMRGFHWMTSYGSYLKEVGYALKKAGIDWLAV